MPATAAHARTVLRRGLSTIRTRPVRRRVNLFIVGEQKCGTSSLHDLLGSAEQIATASRKELHYFDGDEFVPDDARYEANFRIPRFAAAPRYLLDSTPDYCWDHNALRRLQHYNPDATIIMLTREPIARFVSAYRFYRHTVDRNHRALQHSEAGRRMRRFIEREPDFTFERFMEVELSAEPVFDAVSRCDYDSSLDRIGALFPSSRVFTTSLETLTSPAASRLTIGQLATFLDVDLPTTAFPQRNISKGATVELDPALAEILRRRFERS